jgi:hypothetical protein
MSLYHWGTAYPWGANTVAAADEFARLITGATVTSQAPVPDFYADYPQRFDKPFAIVEAAAFYRPGGGGELESAIEALRAAFLAAMTDGFHLGPAVPTAGPPRDCPTQ